MIITSSILFAEELTHSIGMSAGYISGSGISYRQMNEKFGYQTDVFSLQVERIREGIELICNEKEVKKAFELMNETFYRVTKGIYSEWRLFQICFILMLIPDIVFKERRRESVEVLHVQTGGGKSEAYFGCVIFSAFWDRITGKKFGCTAMTKFPLRMLSIQTLVKSALYLTGMIIETQSLFVLSMVQLLSLIVWETFGLN